MNTFFKPLVAVLLLVQGCSPDALPPIPQAGLALPQRTWMVDDLQPALYLARPASLPRPSPSAFPAPPTDALAMALQARSCADSAGLLPKASRRLTLIDFDLPSSEKRLWVIDVPTGKVILNTWVAHGQGSGGRVPDRFSNTEDTHASSLGLMLGLQPFESSKGPALRLSGVEDGLNDQVFQRQIIIHPSNYIGDGKTGRSWGCPAVRPEDVAVVIENTQGGVLYAFSSLEKPRLLASLKACHGFLQPDFVAGLSHPHPRTTFLARR